MSQEVASNEAVEVGGWLPGTKGLMGQAQEPEFYICGDNVVMSVF